MRIIDLLRLAWDNVWRNRARSLLTGTGIAVGVAALLLLLGYGSGLEEIAHREFNALQLQNTLRVTSHPIPGVTSGRPSIPAGSLRHSDEQVPLTDSLIREINEIDGVLAAYPEMQFPAKLRGNGVTLVVTAEGIPMEFGRLALYEPAYGDFFETADTAAVLISRSIAQRLGYDSMHTAVGDTIDLVTASLSFDKLRSVGKLFSGGLRTLPMAQRPYNVRIAGVLDDSQQPVSGLTRVVLPLEFGRSLSKVPFFSTLDLLFRQAQTQEGYSAVRVQLETSADRSTIRSSLDRRGVYTTSFQRQFERLDTLFLVLDLALAIVGSIALIVAILGVANTILMNVRERTREIGIMMALGGHAGDLQRLFVIESGTLGALGGAAGLLVGGLVATGLEYGINFYLHGLGVPPVPIFSLSIPMALAIWTGAILISLMAGIFPARRAARIEPAEALRIV